jgi:hypothetical protein
MVSIINKLKQCCSTTIFYDLYLDSLSAPMAVVWELYHFFGPLEIYVGIKFLVSNIFFLPHIKVPMNQFFSRNNILRI